MPPRPLPLAYTLREPAPPHPADDPKGPPNPSSSALAPTESYLHARFAPQLLEDRQAKVFHLRPPVGRRSALHGDELHPPDRHDAQAGPPVHHLPGARQPAGVPLELRV